MAYLVRHELIIFILPRLFILRVELHCSIRRGCHNESIICGSGRERWMIRKWDRQSLDAEEQGFGNDSASDDVEREGRPPSPTIQK